MTALPDGRTLITWTGAAAGGFEIRAVFVPATGMIADRVHVPVASSSDRPRDMAVTGRADGGRVVVWRYRSANDANLRARLLSPDGAPWS